MNTLNLYHNFVSTNARRSRSENNRMEYLCCIFLQYTDKLGSNGLTISCSLYNVGKTNLQGRLHYAGNVIHRNPTMLLCAVKGLLIFYCFCIIKEPFPDFSYPKNYYGIPILRRKLDRTKAVTYDLLYDKYIILCEIINYYSDSGK